MAFKLTCDGGGEYFRDTEIIKLSYENSQEGLFYAYLKPAGPKEEHPRFQALTEGFILDIGKQNRIIGIESIEADWLFRTELKDAVAARNKLFTPDEVEAIKRFITTVADGAYVVRDYGELRKLQ